MKKVANPVCPELKDSISSTITQSIGRIRSHLKNVDEDALAFYGLTPEQRDAFATAGITTGFRENSLMGIYPYQNTNWIDIVADARILKSKHTMLLDKIVAHELGHWFSNHLAINKFRLSESEAFFQKYGTLSVKMLVGGIAAGMLTGHPFWGAFGSIAGFFTTVPVDLMQSRFREQEADMFSDKIVPEISIVDALKEFDRTNAYNPFYKILHLYAAHPSDYTRRIKSEKNCAEFLDYKQKHGIPSLIFG